jgi:hypothetical protein
MSSLQSETMLKFDRFLQLIAVAYVMAVGCVLVIVQPFPILHDYPEWMFQGWLLESILAGQPDGDYQLAGWPVPNSLTQFALALMSAIISPIAAGKIWLAAYLIVGFICCHRAARLCWPSHSGTISLILVATVLLGPGFWNGYINYQVGLVLLLVGWLGWQWGGRTVWLLIISLLVFFAHAASYAALVAAVGVVVVAGAASFRQRVSMLIALLPSLLLMAWYLGVKLANSAVSLEAPLSLVQWFGYKAYTVAKQGPFHNFVIADGTSMLQQWHWVYLAGALINGLMLLVVTLWFAVLCWQWLRRRLEMSAPVSHDRPMVVLLLTLALIILFLLPGRNNFGVVNLGERFLIPLLGFGLLAFACPPLLLRTWALLCTVAAGLVVGPLLLISSHNVVAYTGPDSDIYAASRHKYFNHRIFIYADRGLFLAAEQSPDMRPQPDAQLATGPLILREQ